MRSPETSFTTPSPSAINTSPESSAARASMPVPTNGASGMMSGTACFCMLAPISARWASSCSTKGISEVATEMICLVDTSISSTSSGLTKSISDVVEDDLFDEPTRRPVPTGPRRTSTRSARMTPFSSTSVLAWAMTNRSSSSAVKYLISPVTLPEVTTRYGVSMKPYSLMRA